MPALEVYDTVKIKNGSIIGTVERIHLGDGAHTIEISEFLIIAHVDVPQRVIIDFATSGGIPPRGYVFVVAAEDAQGAFLAAEVDLELLSRSFDCGDAVKREDGLIGTVTDVFDTYTIQPIWFHLGDQVKHFSEHKVDASSLYIGSVPSRELKAAEEVFEENFVSVNHWLGMVEEADLDVVIKLDNNSLVTITNPSDLFLPITDLDKPLVHLPDFDHISRPHALSAFGGFSSVIATDHPRIGSLVVTSRHTMRTGRWLAGSYDRDVPPQGRVVAVVPRSLVVDWLLCSPFAPLRAKDIRRPSEETIVYQNIEKYTRGDQLVKEEGLRIFDLSLPTDPTTSDASIQQPNGLGGLHPDLRAGDCVRFRDPTAAAVKYQDSRGSGRLFERISKDVTGGWDINVFKVISKKQTLKILWYDGSISESNSNDLTKFGLVEENMRPTDLVLNRSGLQMKPTESAGTPLTDMQTFIEFNEMKYFERPHDLRPQQVGVVQAVDARERVATVRWYKDPHILIQDAGSCLSQSSTFGPIGSVVEDVSMYEIMQFPALQRDHRNLVVVPPQRLSRAASDIIQQGESRRLWRAILNPRFRGSSSGDTDLVFHGARERVRCRGLLETIIRRPEGLADDPGDVDWVGEIVALGLDGSVTVRLSGAAHCRDVTVDADRVLAIIDLDNLPADGDHDEESVDLDMDDISDVSTISESIEYEGGARIDNDTDDENWESAEEDIAQMDSDIDMTDVSEVEEPNTPGERTVPAIQTPRTLAPLVGRPTFQHILTHFTQVAPPSFAVLDIPPPADQHTPPNLSPASPSTFLKRMRFEHKILASSLPPSIYVRTYESNLSLLRCLIIGPTDTPYEHAPFVIDLALPAKYPSEPPIAHFHSWTSGLGRINPNLYEEGKICLSLLGTWPGKESKEQWSKDATILQLLVSLQGLVMVKKPFYNEAGFEDYANEKGYENESAQYSEKAYVMARGFVKHALTQPPGGIKDVLAFEYFRLHENAEEGMFMKVMTRGKALIEKSMEVRDQLAATEGNAQQELLLDGVGDRANDAFLRPLSKGAMVMLNRLLLEMGECLDSATQCFVEGGAHFLAHQPGAEGASAPLAAGESLRRQAEEEGRNSEIHPEQ